MMIAQPLTTCVNDWLLQHYDGNVSNICAWDELSTFDPEMYKQLLAVKHYEGDVGALELTFSLNEEFLGKVRC